MMHVPHNTLGHALWTRSPVWLELAWQARRLGIEVKGGESERELRDKIKGARDAGSQS